MQEMTCVQRVYETLRYGYSLSEQEALCLIDDAMHSRRASFEGITIRRTHGTWKVGIIPPHLWAGFIFPYTVKEGMCVFTPFPRFACRVAQYMTRRGYDYWSVREWRHRDKLTVTSADYDPSYLD